MKFTYLQVEVPGFHPAAYVKGDVKHYGSGKTVAQAAREACKGFNVDQEIIEQFVAENERELSEHWRDSHHHFVGFWPDAPVSGRDDG